MHLAHITQGGDPFEALEARPLDFGHWSAHKLEPMTDSELRHGEAVAIGVAIDTVYSSLALGLPGADADRVLRCLADLGFALDHPALDDPGPAVRGPGGVPPAPRRPADPDDAPRRRRPGRRPRGRRAR